MYIAWFWYFEKTLTGFVHFFSWMTYLVMMQMYVLPFFFDPKTDDTFYIAIVINLVISHKLTKLIVYGIRDAMH